MPDTCSTCRFSAPSKDPRWDALDCRRHPPAPGIRPAWPHTYTDGWCGEHETAVTARKAPAKKRPAVGEVETRGES